MKRPFTFVMAVMLAVGLLPIPAFASGQVPTSQAIRTLRVNTVTSAAVSGSSAKSAKTIKGAAATLYAGSATQNKKTLKAKGLVASKSKWKSSKPAVASVSRVGKVTAKKAGKTTVSAKRGKTTYKFVVTVKNVSINKKKATLIAGKKLTLKLAGDKIKSAKSSNKKIATVSSGGVVKGVSGGKATVTIVSKKNKKFTCQVTVTVPVTSVAFAKKSLTMMVRDGAVSNKATVKPSNATSKTVTYATSNKKVAVVSKSGVITPKAVGTATVSAVASNGKKATCKVTVVQVADYTAVNKAKKRAETVLNDVGKNAKYTKASVKALQSACDAVRTGLSKDKQATVNGWAKAIDTAFGALKLASKAESEARLKAFADQYVSELNAAIKGKTKYPTSGVMGLSDLPVSLGGARSDLSWVSLSGRAVAEYELYFDDAYILKTKSQQLVRDYDPNKMVNVKDYGAIGDGQADDDAAVKAAMAAVNENGGILYFPTGTYRVAVTANGDGAMKAQSKKNVEIDFMKSTIELQANAFQAYSIVRAVNCASIEMRNGAFVGDRLVHDYETLYQGSHESGHGVRAGDNALCNIINMDISDMIGDAIYCNSSGDGITNISDCNLHHCRRQGISVVAAEEVNVRDTEIHDIGCPNEEGTSDKVKGTAPRAGIDLEPNSDKDTIKHVVLDNVESRGNASYGLVHAKSYNAKSLKLDIVGCSLEEVSLEQEATTTISNSELVYPPGPRDDYTVEMRKCTITDTHIKGVGRGNVRLKRSTADRCVFEGEDVGDTGTLSFRFIPVNAVVTNSTFINVQGKGNAKWKSGAIADYGIPLADHPTRGTYNLSEGSGNNVYDGCGVMIDNLVETNSVFKNSYIFKTETVADLTVNSNTFENCTINLKKKPVTFNECTFDKCGFVSVSNTDARFVGSSLKFDSMASKGFASGSFTCDASTIRITGDVVSSALSNMAFQNRSKIVLDSYRTASLDIPKSSQGTDYVIECKGTRSLP